MEYRTAQKKCDDLCPSQCASDAYRVAHYTSTVSSSPTLRLPFQGNAPRTFATRESRLNTG